MLVHSNVHPRLTMNESVHNISLLSIQEMFHKRLLTEETMCLLEWWLNITKANIYGCLHPLRCVCLWYEWGQRTSGVTLKAGRTVFQMVVLTDHFSITLTLKYIKFPFSLGYHMHNHRHTHQHVHTHIHAQLHFFSFFLSLSLSSFTLPLSHTPTCSLQHNPHQCRHISSPLIHTDSPHQFLLHWLLSFPLSWAGKVYNNPTATI